MDKKHYNDLIMLSQEIHDLTNEKLKEYFEKEYATASEESMSQQLEDWLFVAEETGAYMLGNVIALLDANSQEIEIKTFEENLRRVISLVGTKQDGGARPS